MKNIKLFILLTTLFSFLFTACKDEIEGNVLVYQLKLTGLEVVIVPTGGTATIGVEFSPIHTTNKNIEWKSSDTNIVTVIDGVVTGLKAGEAMVEAIPLSDPNKKVIVRVIVNPVPVESITIDADEQLDLEVHDILKITATIMPENAPQLVHWSSSNENIASVSQEGEVVAIKGGEVIITARAIADGVKLATVKLTVSNPNEIVLSHPLDATFFDANSMVFPVEFRWGKVAALSNYSLKISDNENDFTGALVINPDNEDRYAMTQSIFESVLDHFDLTMGETRKFYWTVVPTQSTADNIATNVFSFTTYKVAPLLDKVKFVALPHSSQFTFSPYGTSDARALWNNNSTTLSAENIFYISNKSATYFAVDLGVNASLSSFVYWGRRDLYFQQRHGKKWQIYGTNNSNVANNPESNDSEWTLLNSVPFESTRPSGGTGKPIENDEDWLHGYRGENFVFQGGTPVVRYIRVKCLETWGGLEGLWATEIAFRGVLAP